MGGDLTSSDFFNHIPLNDEAVMKFLGVHLRLVDLNKLRELKTHYDLEHNSQLFLFIRNQKLEPSGLDLFSEDFKTQIISWVVASVNGIAKRILDREHFLQTYDVISRIKGDFRESKNDLAIYLGEQNDNFRVFKRLAESNISFEGFHYCFDWKIGDQLMRVFGLTKYADRDYVIYIRHGSRLLGINELFEDKFASYSKQRYDYFELRSFFRGNLYDKYVENDDKEAGELVNNLYFQGGAAVVFAYDLEDEHKYVEGRIDKVHLKEHHIPRESDLEQKLLKLGHQNNPRTLDDIVEFRLAVRQLPRNVRYIAMDIHNKLGNPLIQMLLQNGHMMNHGAVAVIHVGKKGGNASAPLCANQEDERESLCTKCEELCLWLRARSCGCGRKQGNWQRVQR